jgi:peptidyl-tRNA hydrolase
VGAILMRRLFIMRKDLNMSPGKLAAQVSHCAEAYWTRGLRNYAKPLDDYAGYEIKGIIDKEIFEQYLNGSFTKTICEARNKNHLLKAVKIAQELGLIENVHYGLIYDACLTELTPEENGTTLTGIWFCPLKDDMAHYISKKYQLYH